MTEIRLQRRSLPDRLRYLADKLSEGDQHRTAVMVALEAMAEEISGNGEFAPAALTGREQEAVAAVFAEVREMWRLLQPVITPSLVAEARRLENWRIATAAAERITREAAS